MGRTIWRARMKRWRRTTLIVDILSLAKWESSSNTTLPNVHCRTKALESFGAALFCELEFIFPVFVELVDDESMQVMAWNVTSSGYGQNTISSPLLVIPHPVTNAHCLRWNESWSEEMTNFLNKG